MNAHAIAMFEDAIPCICQAMQLALFHQRRTSYSTCRELISDSG